MGGACDVEPGLAVIVSLAGIAVAAVGLLGVAAPGRLKGILARWRFLTGFPVTLGLRIASGGVFLFGAPYCRLPDLVRLVGVLEILGAALLLLLGPARLQRFVEWWLERPPAFVRYWCSAAFAFGILLAYAGVSTA